MAESLGLANPRPGLQIWFSWLSKHVMKVPLAQWNHSWDETRFGRCSNSFTSILLSQKVWMSCGTYFSYVNDSLDLVFCLLISDRRAAPEAQLR